MHITTKKITLALALSSVFCTAFGAQTVTGREILFDPERPSVEILPSRYPSLIEREIAAGNYRRAMYVIDVGLKKNPRSAQLKFQRCNVLEAMGQRAQARECLKDFIAHYPEISEPYNNLAKIAATEGNVDEAEELLKQAVQINPKFAVAWENLASLYLSRAKMSYEEAAGAGSKTAAERAGAVQALITGKPAAAAQEQTAAASGGTGSSGITVRTVEAGDIKLETARPEEIRTAQ